MKSTCFRLRAPAMEYHAIGAPHVEPIRDRKARQPEERGSDSRANHPSYCRCRSTCGLSCNTCAQQRRMHFDLSVVADETQLAESVHEKN